MKKRTVTALITITAVLLSACGIVQKGGDDKKQSGKTDKQETAGYHKITPEKAKKMMDKSFQTIVDVRTSREFDDERLFGAILLSYDTIGDEPPIQLPSKDSVILIYDRDGKTSEKAAKKLAKMGYKEVYDFGGIEDWPYSTVKGPCTTG